MKNRLITAMGKPCALGLIGREELVQLRSGKRVQTARSEHRTAENPFRMNLKENINRVRIGTALEQVFQFTYRDPVSSLILSTARL